MKALQASLAEFNPQATMPEWALDAQEALSTAQAQVGQVEEAATTLADLLRRRQATWGGRSGKLGVILSRLVVLCQEVNDTANVTHYANWAQTLEN